VTDWKWPDPTEGVTTDDLRAVQAAISARQWREDVRSKDWAGFAVAEAFGLDPSDEQAKAQIKGLLKIWIKNGALVVIEGKDADSKTRKFIQCGPDADDEVPPETAGQIVSPSTTAPTTLKSPAAGSSIRRTKTQALHIGRRSLIVCAPSAWKTRSNGRKSRRHSRRRRGLGA
jgi:hypothetical protein